MAFSIFDPRPFDPDPYNTDADFIRAMTGRATFRKGVPIPETLSNSGLFNSMYWPLNRNARDYGWAVKRGSERRNGYIVYRKSDGSGLFVQPSLVKTGSRGGGIQFPVEQGELTTNSIIRSDFIAAIGNLVNLISLNFRPTVLPSNNDIIRYSHSSGLGEIEIRLKSTGVVNLRVVSDDGTELVNADGVTVLSTTTKKMYTIQVVLATNRGYTLLIDGNEEFDSLNPTGKFSTVDTLVLGGESGVAGVYDELSVYSGVSISDIEDVKTDAVSLLPYKVTRTKSGSGKIYGFFEFEQRCRPTHIFGGGQRSFIEKLTQNIDLTRADEIIVTQWTRDIHTGDIMVVNGQEYEIFGIQNAGGQNHHLQIFGRHLKY